jgi:hypothetical protein
VRHYASQRNTKSASLLALFPLCGCKRGGLKPPLQILGIALGRCETIAISADGDGSAKHGTRGQRNRVPSTGPAFDHSNNRSSPAVRSLMTIISIIQFAQDVNLVIDTSTISLSLQRFKIQCLITRADSDNRWIGTFPGPCLSFRTSAAAGRSQESPVESLVFLAKSSDFRCILAPDLRYCERVEERAALPAFSQEHIVYIAILGH